MAYSKIEQAYLDGLVSNYFPDPVEPEPTLLASADTGMTTDGGAYVGTRLNMPKGLNTPENMQAVGNDIPKTVAGIAKGMAQGFVGLPGDLEGIGRLVLNYMGADVNEQTKLPTTQDVKGFLDQYIKLPELQTSDMGNFETTGEWLAPGGQIKAIKPAVKAIKGAVKMTEGLPVGLSTKAVGQGVDDLGFYSAVSKAADEIQQPKGTGEQFLAQISKTPGVKQDEIIWTGLDDFLKSKKTVTKQEVQDYLANNRVEVKEVQLGNPLTSKEQAEIKALREKDRMTTSDRARFDALSSKEDSGQSPKFSKYALPGGENYREVLLTLPDNRKPPTFEQWLDNYTMMTMDQVNADPRLMEIAQNSYKTDVDKLPRVGGFKSNHFDQPNILAHLRVNDRVDADGKKVLMVEEVQSDWHQAGRKRGYAGDISKELEKINAERTALMDEKLRYEKLAEPYVNDGKDAPQDIVEGWTLAANKLQSLQMKQDRLSVGVPDAPFKNNWQELAMKRAIQMAAEGGYERIAFTTGKTQAARYDLSKQIDELMVTKNQDGTFSMEATLPNGGGIQTVGEDIPADKLDDIVGKDLANTIRKQESKGDVYSADDLRVGGEGMKGFYDNILPKFLDKYAKKWDAKTGMTAINAGEKDGDLFEVVLPNGKVVSSYGSKKQAESSAKSFNGAVVRPIDNGEPVHYIDITPKMRESVMTKGQPMFAIGAGGAGAATQQNQEKK
jgi:hypothetical protein